MDEFDDIVNLEASFTKIGINLGREEGQRLGTVDGITAGIKGGIEIGHELGFYKGCTDIWTQDLCAQALNIRQSTRNIVAALSQRIDATMDLNPATDEFYAALVDIRAKFKVVCHNLGVDSSFLSDVQLPKQEEAEHDAALDF